VEDTSLAARLKWTNVAVGDLKKIHKYDPKTGSHHTEILTRIEKAVESLPTFPQMGRKGRVEGTKELPIPQSPYSISYRIRSKDQGIDILSVLKSPEWPNNEDTTSEQTTSQPTQGYGKILSDPPKSHKLS